MTRTTTNQANQRAKQRLKRRSRHAQTFAQAQEHGDRSQSGVKIRSKGAWAKYLAAKAAR